ncbi:hypothetical protein GCU56_11340 [Geodermatophilus sabuli]|uniref:Cache domain-containing protein n=1 Tax=Geodermatophilus sabuli TaxID=1564158 RepID=A0A7K3W3G0_9ACTN|nr:cache domain-containing protein [Geodermatophilus sabuli]NEK58467.1 hypothetical protein [Geodermatophilus sabuli]
MTASAAAALAADVAAVVEAVFAEVDRLQAAAVPVLHDPSGAAAARLEEAAQALLSPGQLAVGLGLIVAPRAEDGFRLRLLWWQVDPVTGRLGALAPDLRPSSLGFYDYPSTEWFDVPRRTGRRHVVGPYVDVHGTGRYLLTLTEPVLAGGQFLGVVGADVPVGRFEGHLLRRLGPTAPPFVLVDEEGRVVLSTSPVRLVGALVQHGGDLPGPGVPVAGVPWRLHAVDDGGDLLPG